MCLFIFMYCTYIDISYLYNYVWNAREGRGWVKGEGRAEGSGRGGNEGGEGVIKPSAPGNIISHILVFPNLIHTKDSEIEG